ncbi:MAG: DUF6090 family protein, partial [Flavobacteriaceae bacterium]|nr:DUF6090 family protein [Flavobacteriaceae bacterium]
MIKFFRQIRRNMISENRTYRYLFYAIGEIILVVIGILIALQVNTWNNQRIDAELAESYLKEIRSSLKNDLQNIEQVLDYNSNKHKAIDSVFSIMESNEPQSIKNQRILPHLQYLTDYSVFVPNSVAFDNMIASSTINLIKTAKLRELLSNYYNSPELSSDFTQEQVKLQTRRFVDESITLLLNDEIVEKLSGYSINLAPSGDFFSDPLTFKNLFNMQKNILAQNDILESSSNQIKILIQKIE